MEVKLFRPTMRNTQLVGVELTADDGMWLELYFSYDTIVAFHMRHGKMVVSHNVWSNTTGRHLNEIDGGRKENRVNPTRFQRSLAATLRDFFDA